MSKKQNQMTVIECSIVPIYEKNCIDGSNLQEQVVNSRELWSALDVKTEYSHWAKRRLDDVDAVENIDYLTVVKKDGRQTMIDYILTMDTAKEMAMLERNEMGKRVRRYFIEADKRYREMKVIRARAKAERKLFTDIIRDILPESPSKKWAYKSFTDLVYKHVTGYNSKQLRELYGKPPDYNVRELLSPQQLREVVKYEGIIQGLLQLGQDYQGVKAILDHPELYLPGRAV